ncbi:MAG: dihydropteroate synthase [Treponema sp.]|nr:dihydropteroate synthase [Treponema sp.]
MLQLQLKNKNITTQRPAFVMGILNVTPDSFFDKSRGGIERAFQLIEEGADVLDIGGESTRPGYTPVSAEDEIKRIIPVIKEIRKQSDIPLSVDTMKYEVMKAALEEGADIFNDVTALENDERKIQLVLENNINVILMHQFYGDESTRVTDSQVNSVVTKYLLQKADFLVGKGLNPELILLDPGIGFGKTPEENIMLIKDFCSQQTKYKVLMALSRKRCIGTMVENGDKLTGTIVSDIFAVKNGASMIRVHDVKEAVASLNVMKYLQ